MLISVQKMVINGEVQTPEFLDATLHQFFIEDAHDYQESSRFPFTLEGREGGCQFSFDRDQSAPMRCINCNQPICTCDSSFSVRNRYALQRFTSTSIYILDIDLNSNRPRNKPGWCKYHSLLYSEELELRLMEQRLMKLDNVSFFYRTKCNGFRVAFEADCPIADIETYESLCIAAEEQVRLCTPDRRLGNNSGDWFHVDRIGGRRSLAYWSYPRVCNPIWLNPSRRIL